MNEKAQVLVVEDDLLQAAMMQDALEPLQVEVRFVRSAEAALTSAAERVPDIVFADHVLPGRTGLDLLLELGVQKGKTRRVLITSRPDVPSWWGSDIPVLWKPFDAATLRWLTRRLLAQLDPAQSASS